MVARSAPALYFCRMSSKSWNSLASDFENDVLEITTHDLSGALKQQVRRVAKGQKTAADLGCGPGSLLPLLCRQFRTVHAVDYAAELLKVAGQRYKFTNVQYLKHDLAGKKALPFKVDVTFSVNALICKSDDMRHNMAKTLWQATKKKGRCVVVVPSMESVTHVHQALARCNERDGMSRAQAVAAMNRHYKKTILSQVGGIVSIGGVPTKCYTREEISIFLAETGFTIEKILRVEYPWSEEIDHAPRWLKEPYPWDWLVVGKKR